VDEMEYEIFAQVANYLMKQPVFPQMVDGFAKFLMRQGGFVRSKASYKTAVWNLYRAQRFYEWHEFFIYDAYESGLSLSEYASVQEEVAKIILKEMLEKKIREFHRS
jgi:hypothetical protein